LVTILTISAPVIVRGGEALARGRNLWNEQQDSTAHAEMVAIRDFSPDTASTKSRNDPLL
jgi:tRNA(Arg) A34 adenosine deaminase TadA